jgi:hypothetical protein
LKLFKIFENKILSSSKYKRVFVLFLNIFSFVFSFIALFINKKSFFKDIKLALLLEEEIFGIKKLDIIAIISITKINSIIVNENLL